jgi:hypothetical protein
MDLLFTKISNIGEFEDSSQLFSDYTTLSKRHNRF